MRAKWSGDAYGNVAGGGTGITDTIAKWISSTTIGPSTWSISSGNLSSTVAGQTISVPGLASLSEVYGASSSVNSNCQNTTVVGYGINLSDCSNTTAIGNSINISNSSDSFFGGYNVQGGSIQSVSIGSGSNGGGGGCVSIGYNAQISSSYQNCILIGGSSTNLSQGSIGIGQGVYLSGIGPNVVIGQGLTDSGNSDIINIGYNNSINSSGSINIGKNSSTNNNDVLIGHSSTTNGSATLVGCSASAANGSCIFGYTTHDNGNSNCSIFGANSYSNGQYVSVFGYQSYGSYYDTVVGAYSYGDQYCSVVGYQSYCGSSYNNVFGYNSYASGGPGNVVIGAQINDGGYGAVINIGYNNNVQGSSCILLSQGGSAGTSSTVVGISSNGNSYSYNSIFGANSSANGSYSTICGYGSTITASDSYNTIVGISSSITSGQGSSIVGYNNSIADNYCAIIGNNNQISSGSGDSFVAGYNSAVISGSAGAIAIGNSVTVGYGSAASTGSIGIGSGNMTISGVQITAVGYGTIVSSAYASAYGTNVQIGAGCGFSFAAGYGAVLGNSAQSSIAILANCQETLCVLIGRNASLSSGSTATTGIGYGVTIGSGCTNSTVVGAGASLSANSTFSTAVGVSAAIGNGTTYATICGYLTGIGSGAIAHYSSAFGAAHQVGHVSSMALGYGLATTATQQCIIGNAANQFTDFVFGGNPSQSTVSDVTFRIPAKSGSNVLGKDFYREAGNGTGSSGSGSHIWRTAPVAASSSTANTMRNVLIVDNAGQIKAQVAGAGYSVKEGTNAKMGTAVLVLGTLVVNTTAVTATSRIFLCHQNLGTITVPVGLAVSARTAGTSFTILSGNLTDTSTIAWVIFEPS